MTETITRYDLIDKSNGKLLSEDVCEYDVWVGTNDDHTLCVYNKREYAENLKKYLISNPEFYHYHINDLIKPENIEVVKLEIKIFNC